MKWWHLHQYEGPILWFRFLLVSRFAARVQSFLYEEKSVRNGHIWTHLIAAFYCKLSKQSKLWCVLLLGRIQFFSPPNKTTELLSYWNHSWIFFKRRYTDVERDSHVFLNRYEPPDKWQLCQPRAALWGQDLPSRPAALRVHSSYRYLQWKGGKITKTMEWFS